MSYILVLYLGYRHQNLIWKWPALSCFLISGVESFLKQEYHSSVLDLLNVVSPSVCCSILYITAAVLPKFPALLTETSTTRIDKTCHGYMSKDGHINILNYAHLALFDYSEWGFFSVARQMSGCNRQRRAWPKLFPGIVTLPECLEFAASLTLDMTNLGSNPGEPSSQSYAPS